METDGVVRCRCVSSLSTIVRGVSDVSGSRILPTMSSELSYIVTFECFLCHLFCLCVLFALPLGGRRINQSINQSWSRATGLHAAQLASKIIMSCLNRRLQVVRGYTAVCYIMHSVQALHSSLAGQTFARLAPQS